MSLLDVLKRKPQKTEVTKEVSKERYLATLSSTDQSHIDDYLKFLQEERLNFQNLRNLRIGVIAFGSSVRPESMRYHPVEDIDLRVLTSAVSNSKEQASGVKEVISLTGKFLRDNIYEVGYNPRNTLHSRVVEMQSSDSETGKMKKEIGPFYLDYSNNDPSFRLTAKEGLPLHVSISGPGEETLDLHLSEERRQRQYFSVLGLF